MPVRKTLAEKKGVIMRRAMTLIVVMSVLLFSQVALAEVEFQIGEPVLTKVDEVQHQEVTATVFKIVPLQAVATDSGGLPKPWWHLDEVYYLSAQFTVYGTGTFYARVKVTDVKTGAFITFPKTAYEEKQRGTAPIYRTRLGLPRGNTTSCLPSNSSIFLTKLSSPQGLPFFVLSLSVFTT